MGGFRGLGVLGLGVGFQTGVLGCRVYLDGAVFCFFRASFPSAHSEASFRGRLFNATGGLGFRG